MSEKLRILIVETDPKLRKTLSETLAAKDYTPTITATGKEALDSVKEEKPAVVLIDLRLEDMSGLDVMRGIKECSPDTECILITDHASQASAIEAINLGAYNYILKPCNMDQLLLTITRAIEKKKAVEALEEQERYFRSLFYSMHEDIIVIDPDYRIVDINNTALVTTGFRREEAIGKHCFEVSHGYNVPCDEAGEECILKKVLETGEAANCYHEHERADGSTAHVDILFSPLEDTEGNLTHVIEAVRDITDLIEAKELLRESEEKHRFLFENLVAGIGISDRSGRVFAVNKAMSGITGFTLNEFSKINLRDIYVNHEERKRFIDILKREGKVENFEVQLRHKDGETYWANLSSTTIKYDGKDAILTTLLDITERKQAEEELEKYREQLEELVEVRTRELREIQEELVRKEKLAVVGQLGAGIGHELRNPLGSIKNAAYFLNMAIDQPDPEVKEALEILQKEVQNSTQIISSLLDFASPKTPFLRLANINEIVRDAFSGVPLPENVEIVSRPDKAVQTVSVDPHQLEVVFGNLILNAIQAMPEGGRVVVRTSASSTEPSEAPDEKWVEISITDTGVGISEENQEKVFEPLYTTRAKGIGLGLAVCKILVEGHGGKIEVESPSTELGTGEEGKGSTFTVKLPVKSEN